MEKVVKHYAITLFDIIDSDSSKSKYHINIINLYFFLQKNYFFEKIISSNFIKKNKKIIIIKNIFNNIFIYNFLKILIINDRIFLLKKILSEYKKIYNIKKKNIIKCILITAVPINKKIQKMIARKIINDKKKEFIIVNNINKDIIGGFLFINKYREWDFSIKRCLNEINKKI
ncbi:F0F1 ATP synthase subunit delta [Blattabacterium cuenoti]|uniref:F0F1 ATP synthase subunit delta n=1 Tax=Blattabacterium cuenoti TaxID=1653831 RepID=UPI00163B9DB3|nr:F0F1 ATP synthase subunit delta [Blattabacterium cuenoti]